MKAILVMIFPVLLTQYIYAQQNLALNAKIIEYEHLNNIENIIDGTMADARNCKYNDSYVILELEKSYKLDSIALHFTKERTCDNWIKSVKILVSKNNNEYQNIKHFGEKHRAKFLSSKLKKEKARFVKILIRSLEDCEEREYLCFKEIEIFPVME
jgi:hypothetical protein